ncbi:sodium- and chloride-dependent GABA transporter ine [Pelomyxa schiedti]|nr:sodium- and chloride-dependent GABA transporter ine [Pelomyxa schiedti]
MRIASAVQVVVSGGDLRSALRFFDPGYSFTATAESGAETAVKWESAACTVMDHATEEKDPLILTWQELFLRGKIKLMIGDMDSAKGDILRCLEMCPSFVPAQEVVLQNAHSWILAPDQPTGSQRLIEPTELPDYNLNTVTPNSNKDTHTEGSVRDNPLSSSCCICHCHTCSCNARSITTTSPNHFGKSLSQSVVSLPKIHFHSPLSHIRLQNITRQPLHEANPTPPTPQQHKVAIATTATNVNTDISHSAAVNKLESGSVVPLTESILAECGCPAEPTQATAPPTLTTTQAPVTPSCYKNGGGAFVIVYLLMMFLLGFPVFVLELALGQRFQSGMGKLFGRMHPRFSGLGITAVIGSTFVALYYIVICGWSLFFFGSSFQDPLPWQNRANEFFYEDALNLSQDISHVGSTVWAMWGCLFAAWVLTYLCIFKGIKSSGKIVFVTATGPYLVLIALLIRSLMLDGASTGLKYYLIPTWSKILSAETWRAATIQVCYSMGIGYGSLSSHASFNPPETNYLRVAGFVSVADFITSFISGLVVFSGLGHISELYRVPMDQVAVPGVSLAFVTYPQVLCAFPAEQFFSVCFFIMLLLLGIDSEFSTVEVLVTAIKETDIKKKFKYARHWLVTLTICIILWLLGWLFVTQAGMYFVSWFDSYMTIFILPCVCLGELLVVTWYYSGTKLCTETFPLFSSESSALWVKLLPFLWAVVAPLMILYTLAVTIVSLVKGELNSTSCITSVDTFLSDFSTAGSDFSCSDWWVEPFGILIGIGPLVLIPVVAVLNWNKKPPSHADYVAYQAYLEMNTTSKRNSTTIQGEGGGGSV